LTEALSVDFAAIRKDLMATEPGSPDRTCQIEGRYANYLEIGNNTLEFVLDFGQCYSGSETPYIHTRIITNASDLRSMLRLLVEALECHERERGTRGNEDLET
jgi:hypothetical protein